jgi:thiamine pyrophosphokinase
MRVFVVAGSPVARPPLGLAPASGERVIAADLGAKHAMDWGWPVDLLVGDLDSLPAELARQLETRGTPAERAPAAKDETDTELALRRALDLAPDQIILCGATGGRTDHLLANLLLLAHRSLAGADIRVVDGGETVRLLHAADEEAWLSIEGQAGDLVSLLPLGQDAVGVTTREMLYPLHAETLHLGEARGVSNVMTGSRGAVGLQRGRLLIVQNRMEE